MNLRYSLRHLRQSPGFSLVAILTLAIGIGANTAVFSVLQGVLLSPLPYPKADRLMNVWLYRHASGYPIDDSYFDFLDWRRDARSFEEIAAFNPQDYDLTSPGAAEHLSGLQVSAGFFRTLGTKLAMGREFLPEEDVHGAQPVAIVSDRLLKSAFGGSASAIGRALTLSGVSYTVVGVLPPGFRFEEQDADVYTPIGQRDPLLNDRTIHNVACIARLRDGVTPSEAQAEMNALQENIDRLYPAAERGLDVQIVPFKQQVVGDVRSILLLLSGAAGLVLLIACANVANLLLARSKVRSREFAIRSALGARRSQIVRQLIGEAIVLSAIGAVLGLLFARWGVKAALATFAQSLPRSQDIGLNGFVLLFAMLCAIVVGFLFSIMPAFKSSGVNVLAGLKDSDRGSSRGNNRTQSMLVVAQMALTLLLLTGAGLLLRTIHRLWKVNPGFQAQHVLTFKVGLSPSAIATPGQTRIAYQQLVQRIRQIPGVEAAEITALLPFSQQDNSGPFWFTTHPPASMAEAPRAIYYWTGPDYLQAMQIPLLRGRYFSAHDTLDSEPVVVIDSAFAQTYFPNQDPIGKTVTVAHWRTARIIGEVGEVKHWTLGNPTNYTHPAIYGTFYQLSNEWVPGFRDSVSVVVRTRGDAATIMSQVKAAIYGSSNDQPIYAVRTMQEYVSDSLSAQSFPMMLLGAFAIIALVLASVGIYGVVAYWTAQRVREIGIRMALGAERGSIVGMVVKHGIRLAVIGIAMGGAAALVLSKLMAGFSNLLYGVSAGDPLTFLCVSAILGGIACLACYIPARRAASTDPIQALRAE